LIAANDRRSHDGRGSTRCWHSSRAGHCYWNSKGDDHLVIAIRSAAARFDSSSRRHKIDIVRAGSAVRFPRNGADENWIEDITLRDIDEVEEDTAETGRGIARDAVRRRLQRHRAGGDFVQSIVDRIRFSHVGKRNIDGDVAVWSECRLAVRWR